jgi:hypothetical protein
MPEMECPDCGTEIESTADLEQTEVAEVETDDDGSFELYGNEDLYLCNGCKKPLGVGRS